MRSTEGTVAGAARPPFDRQDAAPLHSVRFYDHDAVLIQIVADFLAGGLGADEAALVIATPAHRTAIVQCLAARGVAIAAAQARGQYVDIDAAEALNRLLRDGGPDERLFRATIGRHIETALAHHSRLRVFDEMVALLWDEGSATPALQLEEIWNRLGYADRLSLLCAYPFEAFAADACVEPFVRICHAHGRVLAPPRDSAPESRSQAAPAQRSAARALAQALTERDAPDPAPPWLEARQRGDFLTTLARELRRPLAPVASALQLLRLSQQPDQVARACDVIERQTQRLARLTDDLLDLAGIMTQRIQLQREMVRLTDIIERALSAARPGIHERGHKLLVELPTSPVWLFADAARLERILVHLLHGAARYADLGGTIRVNAYCGGDWLTLTLSDSGSTLSPELREHGLDALALPAAARERDGTGEWDTGLAFARAVLALHDGALELRSDAPERGSEIALRLPLRPERGRALEAEPGAVEARAPHPRRFLIVDDDLDAADALGELLQVMGHGVRVSYSGRAAIDMVRRFRPEVVLLDVDMPEMDGCEVARRLRAEHGEAAPVLVAVSGFEHDYDPERVRRAGFDQHLVKPLDARKLESLSRAVAGRDSGE